MPNLRAVKPDAGTIVVLPGRVTVKLVSATASVVGAGLTVTVRLLVPPKLRITKLRSLLAVAASVPKRMMSPTRRPLVTGSPAVKVNVDAELSLVTLVNCVFDSESADTAASRCAATRSSNWVPGESSPEIEPSTRRRPWRKSAICRSVRISSD